MLFALFWTYTTPFLLILRRIPKKLAMLKIHYIIKNFLNE